MMNFSWLRRSLLSILCAFVAGNGMADIEKESKARSIDSDYVNLPVKTFLESLSGKDTDQRHNAKIYLLGVLDATEGGIWCDYKKFKTISLQEYIHHQLQKEVKAGASDRRAATAIKDALAKLSPCGGSHETGL